MMKKLFFIFVLFLFLITANNSALCRNNSDRIISNRMFSIAIPNSLNGTYAVNKSKDKIYIYDKASKKAGFGGFAFAIRAYKNPKDHAVLPGSVKIGELVSKKGEIYDMVLKYPTDVQYDYTKDEPLSYKNLYELGESVKISGVNKNQYFKNQGMKGEDLYKEILDKHVRAINEKWDSNKLEKENMSYMYNVLSKNNENVLSKVGYAFYDVNHDGIDELFIGEITQGVFKGIIYDIYTMKDRKPIHVISGGNRDRYYTNGSFIINEYLSGSKENGWIVYNLVENSAELFFQLGFKYDGYADKNNPWFISYNLENDAWENVSKDVFTDRKANFDNYMKFDYIPLNKVK